MEVGENKTNLSAERDSCLFGECGYSVSAAIA